jgi:hypothetical protein
VQQYLLSVYQPDQGTLEPEVLDGPAGTPRPPCCTPRPTRNRRAPCAMTGCG